MTTCERLADLDALVMGELDSSDARALRAHADTCSVCAPELEMLAAERALFARRADALDVLPPLPALPPLRMESPKNTAPRRILPALGRIAMRGHFTAACAAALFVVASLSRLGTASVSTAMSDDVASMHADERAGARMFASYGDHEPLACSLAGSVDGVGLLTAAGPNVPPSRGAPPGVAIRDDGAMTSSSSGGFRGELLACVGGAGNGSSSASDERAFAGGTCEPSAILSELRE